MPRTGMTSRPWMRAPMKGRREAIGPGISELSSSVQKSVKCLLHFHAYLVVVGFLPCFSHALLGSGCLLCRSPFSGQVEGARPAGMEQQSPEGDPECQGQDIPYTPMGRGKEITVEAVVKKEESSEASSSTEDKKAEPASASAPPRPQGQGLAATGRKLFLQFRSTNAS